MISRHGMPHFGNLEVVLEIQCAVSVVLVALLPLIQSPLLPSHAPFEENTNGTDTHESNKLQAERDGIARDVPRRISTRVYLPREYS